MKGFSRRATVDEALTWLDSVLPERSQLPVEEVLLRAGAGRILAGDVISQVDVPAFVRSMMDGFAVRSEETYGATPYNSIKFQIVGTSLPGAPYTGNVSPCDAVRIMTGAALPDGADAVLPVEFTETQKQTMLATGEVSPGKHVGAVAEDVRRGSVVLNAGRRLRPQDLGVLSSTGCGRVSVIRQPRVRILITGNEILPSGMVPSGTRIADANGPMLHALVTRDGGLPLTGAIIPDDREQLLAEMSGSADPGTADVDPADIVLVSGGSSVGQEDHAPQLLSEHGTLAIHGIAMRPSSPAGMGILQNQIVFLLPGNPVSCLCAYDFFAGRAIRSMSGLSKDWPYRIQRARLIRKLVSAIGRVDYARVILNVDEAEPLAIGGASVLTSTTLADGFVIIPADSEGYAEGSDVDVLLY